MPMLQDRIKERRAALGLTLLELAEQLGVKEATMQRYESGEIKNIKHETVYTLSQLLKCSPSYLMGWTDTLIDSPVKCDNRKLTNRQLRIIELFDDLTEEQQDNLIGRAEMLVELNEQEIKRKEDA